jgi:3-dehydroquinate synthase
MMKSMSRVTIALPPRPYDAVIENGLLQRSGETLRDLFNVIFNVNAAAGGSPAKHQRLFVVTVPPVRRKWGKQLLSSLSAAGFTAKIVEMPNGERHKKLATVEKLCEQLSRLGADRNSVIIAFGGGIVGDVAGLVASLYMRGVDLVQIPTTVLAQVDASIGGKTGVNLRAGKNLVGTFHHPSVVLIDPAVLSTLPEREFRAGLYEALKCGVIGKPELFLALENVDIKKLRRDPVKLEWIITESVKLKAEVVSSDERESGLRRVLNLGHTIGHALESQTAYRHFLHGEAVAWGMIASAKIAAAVGLLENNGAARIVDATRALGPLPKVQSRSRDILRLLKSDKKTRNGVVHFVLPSEIGKVEIANDIPEQVVIEAVDELRRLSR